MKTAFVDAGQVAELTGFGSAKAFLKQRARLERDEDFPPPMPTCLRPLKWRRDQVEGWVAATARAPGQTRPLPVPGGTAQLLRLAARG